MLLQRQWNQQWHDRRASANSFCFSTASSSRIRSDLFAKERDFRVLFLCASIEWIHSYLLRLRLTRGQLWRKFTSWVNWWIIATPLPTWHSTRWNSLITIIEIIDRRDIVNDIETGINERLISIMPEFQQRSGTKSSATASKTRLSSWKWLVQPFVTSSRPIPIWTR